MRRTKAFTLVELPVVSRAKRAAFTLVELLVVIAIIAALIAMLLPVISGARKQAGAVRCATQLREIGHTFQLYALDNRGYYPPSQLHPEPAFKYELDGVEYAQGSHTGPYWFNFLAKYVTKSKLGYAADGAGASVAARSTIFWGCPAWEPYRDTQAVNAPLGGINPVFTGYGMTYWPDASPEHPADRQYPLPQRSSYIYGWAPVRSTYHQWRWWKQKTFDQNAASKALVADSRIWVLNADAGPEDGQLPRQSLTDEYNGPNQTFADLYRHGRYPPVEGEQLSNRGGKVAFNILYCDGHVATTGDWREAYRAVRMRFPG